MFRHALAISGFIALALLGGCSPEANIEKFTNDAEQARAIQLIEMMRDGKVDELAPKFAASLQSPQLRPTLRQMAGMMPAGEPKTRTLVGAYVNFVNGVRSSNLTYQYDFGDRWFLVNCAHEDSGPNAGIFGMQIVPLEARLQAQPEFSLRGKSAKHYATVTAAGVAILLTIVALITCILDRGLKMKWLWVLFILVGVMRFTLDWNTGQHEIGYYWLTLFSTSASAQPYGSWVLGVSLPLGAVVYLVRRIWNHRRPRLSNAVNS